MPRPFWKRKQDRENSPLQPSPTPAPRQVPLATPGPPLVQQHGDVYRVVPSYSTDQSNHFPTHIACKLVLFYEGTEYNPEIEIKHVQWQSKSQSTEQFRLFDQAARLFLRDRCQISDTYRKSGRVRLMRLDRTAKGDKSTEVADEILDNEHQWLEVLPNLVGKFCLAHRDVRFELLLHWEYADLTIKKIDGQPYAVSVHNFVYDKMEKNWAGKKFLPREILKATFTESTVRTLIDEDKSLQQYSALWKELANQGIRLDAEKLKTDVFLEGTRLLAICILIRLKLECLFRLLAAGKRDFHLPLKMCDLKEIPNSFDRDNFFDYQGGFIAHDFLRGEDQNEHQEVATGVVVPVMFNKDTDRIGSGGFGEVFKARIHSEHHMFSPNRDCCFAVKRFSHYEKRAKENFQQEQSVLKKLALRPHGHITLHLSSWAQDGRFHIIFPLAEHNLDAHLRLPFPGFDKNTVLWLFRQLHGLAAAVEHIHNSKGLGAPQSSSPQPGLLAINAQQRPHTGYHHDLKPENILLFKEQDNERYTMKISDFGTAKLVFVMSGSGAGGSNPTESLGFGDRAYCAPDFSISGETSRPYDIWSLGCIFLEVIMWAFDEGGQTLELFRQERYMEPPGSMGSTAAFWFRHTTEKTVSLKPAVVKKLQALQGTCKGRGEFPELLRLTEVMLTIKSKERPAAPIVRSALSGMLEQAEHDLAKDANFYRRVPGPRSDDTVIAGPATLAYTSTSREKTIDDRKVEAPWVERLSPHRNHRRSFSDPAYDERPSLSLAITSTGTPFVGSHLTVTDTNGSPHQGRPRSPSISITGPDDESADPSSGAVTPWNDTEKARAFIGGLQEAPTRAEIPTLRRIRSGSSGSMTM